MPNIDEIVELMSLDEKAALCTGASAWTTTPIPRLGIPEMLLSDGPHGVRRVPDVHALGAPSLPATCFPTASCLASTWDIELIHTMGEALAAEAIALGVDVLLGPGVNMKRTPLCGRNFEYLSEDPYLAGVLATALIDGIQRKGVGVALKHFAANNQETQRFVIDAEVDERTLHEIYLPAFETAVKQAQPWTVMCAYNKLNGTYCSEHYELLVGLLKHEWGFAGLVVSDWGAVHDRVKAVQGGLDLEMPGPKTRRTQAVIDAVRRGELDKAVLDEAVRRILRIVFKAAATPKGGAFDAAVHHALAQRVAGDGMVLLKNNGLLPLQSPQRIAVIGRAATEPHFQGGGSSHINPTQVDKPLDKLRERASGAQVSYCEGYPATAELQPALIDEAVAAAQAAEVALIYVALPSFKESEGYDRADLDLTSPQVALIQAVSVAQPNSVVILNNGSALAMSEWMGGVAAVLEAWMMGQAGGGAIADVLYGVVNPSGKLAETFPLSVIDTPASLNFPGENGAVRYGEGIYIGYRYYDAKDVPVLFPFGHGLSYTTFAYRKPAVSATEFMDTDGLTVTVEVTNTGRVAGAEIVQVYVHDHKSALPRPPKELKGFAKLHLQPGATKTATIALDARAFAYYHPGYHQWITEDGEFDILIGASSVDIRHRMTVTLRATHALPSLLNRESTIRAWLEDGRGRAIVEPLFQQIVAQMAATFGVGDSEGIGMDMMGFMMDMPLLGMLEFQEESLPVAPVEIVDGLLAQLERQPA